MKKLLIISCSDKKNRDLKKQALPALTAYDGVFYQIIRKAKRENKFSPDIDILILSTFYGFLRPEDTIEHYNQIMTEGKANEMRKDLTKYLIELVTKKEYSKVYVILGKNYRRAIEGFENFVNPPVEYIICPGIGHYAKKLKEIITI